MPNLPNILRKSYLYTKNHKYLWFFGFFLTGGAVTNFIRYVDIDLNNFQNNWSRFSAFIHQKPNIFIAVIAAFLISLFIVFILGALARASIIDAANQFEKQEITTFQKTLNRGIKKTWSVLLINLAINLVILVLLLWLFVPVFYVFSRGLNISSFFLALIAASIFFPLFVTLSMVNIFACCFSVIFKLSWINSLKSGFDLFSRFWGTAVSLLILLFVIYFVVFFFAASILSLAGLLAYLVSILIKSLSLGLYYAIISVASVLLGIIFLLIYAVLNVFTNIAWTLFFLEVIRPSPIEETKVEPVVEPVV